MLTRNIGTWQRRLMPKRSHKTKLHIYVPDELFADSETIYRAQVAAKVKGAKITTVQVQWTVLGWLISRATTKREVSKIIRDFKAGKPLVLPASQPEAS
jgi:hypothetical protein